MLNFHMMPTSYRLSEKLNRLFPGKEEEILTISQLTWIALDQTGFIVPGYDDLKFSGLTENISICEQIKKLPKYSTQEMDILEIFSQGKELAVLASDIYPYDLDQEFKHMVAIETWKSIIIDRLAIFDIDDLLEDCFNFSEASLDNVDAQSLFDEVLDFYNESYNLSGKDSKGLDREKVRNLYSNFQP